MIRLLFVGDGERDAVTVPRLVERILGAEIREETERWARLHGTKPGYGRKVLYAIRQARDLGTGGLVATVDADRDREGRRLREMREARDAERTRSPAFPAALGQAIPHGEAWLLDDALAVRDAMKLPKEANVPTVRQAKNPKRALEDLLHASHRSGERPLEVWVDIASSIDLSRCAHASETGFAEFIIEVRRELGPLATFGTDGPAAPK